ncbi:protein TIFY 10A-like [Lycium ferocissimum]|uniref:protein TIFY 10A-like n=1 Tax=Lycium ferocissimum TaxID=112874 RepID=UPI0028161665|nr:protein TIFY 10A-like [Lycium ferocissimum]
MASSEIVDSGRFAGQKSHFSQTCSLLSQYLKEKGSFGDLSLGINRNFDSTGSTTMDLLPKIEKSSESKSMNLFPEQGAAMKTESEPEKAQMTIFYAGQVIVFNDFPADKAKEIMLMASASTTNNALNQINNFPCAMVPPKQAESVVDLVTPQMPSQSSVSDLPIARRASLTRFLEKRKDRLTTKAPYQISNFHKQAASPKVEENKAWLGLGAQFPVKTEQY